MRIAVEHKTYVLYLFEFVNLSDEEIAIATCHLGVRYVNHVLRQKNTNTPRLALSPGSPCHAYTNIVGENTSKPNVGVYMME